MLAYKVIHGIKELRFSLSAAFCYDSTFLLGRNSGTSAFSWLVSGRDSGVFVAPVDIIVGLPVLTPGTIPSGPTISRSTILIFHFPWFFSSPFTITTSPIFKLSTLLPCFMLCRSRRALRYSDDHFFHNASLHRRICFALVRRSGSRT